jgi:hypothetical protein
MASSSSIASQLLGTPNHGTAGSVDSPQNTGKGQGSGVRTAPGGPVGPRTPDIAAAMMPPTRPPPRGAGAPPQPRQPQPQQRNNPMMGTAPPPQPRPGLAVGYPDARSVAATIMPDGQPVMPPPTGFLQAGMIPRVPLSFAHGAVPQNVVPHSAPPTMPPVAQSHMPTMANSMQTPHIPPGGAPMPLRAGQTPQASRRPGMSGLLAHMAPPAGGGPAMPQAAPMGRPAGGIQRPVPGGPPVRAPDGNFYVHRPHAGGLYHRVVGLR